MKQEILYLEQIVTTQPSGQNLEYVSLSLRAGEILGVTGISESGASVLRMYCAASYARLRARSIWMAFRSATVRRTKPASWEFTRLPIRLP